MKAFKTIQQSTERSSLKLLGSNLGRPFSLTSLDEQYDVKELWQ